MSEMPERIWAARYNQHQMWFSPALSGATDTEYVRADIVDDQLMRCHAFYKEQAETCRALIKEALPLWDWDDPEHDPFTAHPFEQNVRTALRYQASEINRLANAQQNIIAEKDAEIERLRGGVVAEIQRLKHLNDNAVTRIEFLEKALEQAAEIV